MYRKNQEFKLDLVNFSVCFENISKYIWTIITLIWVPATDTYFWEQRFMYNFMLFHESVLCTEGILRRLQTLNHLKQIDILLLSFLKAPKQWIILNHNILPFSR